MPVILEPIRAADERSLSDILEPDVDEKYWISEGAQDRLFAQEGAKMFSRCASRGKAGYPWSVLGLASRSIVHIRKMTPLEQERAMGIPDNWTSGFTDNVRYLMTGNAVAVPVAKAIAENLMRDFMGE